MKPVLIAFGGNLSNPKARFLEAREALEARGSIFQAVSGLWQSPAWPADSGAPDYLNAVAEIRYDGTPQELMRLLLAVESECGRVRSIKNAPRTLDLDMLVWADMQIETPHLHLPHPRMLERPFVLLPLLEIAPDWRDPITGLTALEHLAKLPVSDVMALRRISDFS